uniref:Trichohyalin-like n=1 Tax=Mastacembelus armatus TaxID=205130 RepID=A0A7N8Y8V3_9TELE
MSLEEQQWCPSSAQVTVLQARGLRIKGKHGTNDAYAVMQVGKEKYQTSVAEKSVAPVWKEEAAFDLPPLPEGGGGGGERGTLHVHVMHRALVGPDKLLGQAVINLLQLSEDKTRNKTEWFKLLDKTGKADKDRGEVLLDIQFMRNNMTASMFDLSAAGKSRSRLSKFKDKVRGKKKESDTVSSVVPSFTQVLTDSEGEANGDEEVAAGKDEKKKKKNKMKSLFSPKSNLQKNMSQSMSVLPEKNSSLSGSQSSGLNVESSEGKKKFKFTMHKHSDSKDSTSGHQKHGATEQSNLCINGSHVYCEEPQPRTSRIGSNFSLASSGLGSMEDVPASSLPSLDSLSTMRQYSPWTEEEEGLAEEENVKEDTDDLRGEEEERIKMEEERSRVEQERVRRQEEELERLAEKKRRQEQEERKKIEEEKVQREEEERVRREEEERQRLAEEKRKLEQAERRRIVEKEKRQREEEERIRMEEERAQEERRRQEQEERKRIEEEKVKWEEEERIRKEKEHKRREEEERVRREEEYQRLAEEKRRLEQQERKRIEEEEKMQREEEERIRMEEERAQEERRRQEQAEKLRRQEEECKIAEEKRLMEEKRRLEEENARKEEEEKIRKEEARVEEERKREEEKVRRQEEERETKRRLEEQERQREEEERIRKEEERRQEEERARKEKEEYERVVEDKRKLEEEQRRIEAEEKIRREEEQRLRVEEERRRRNKEEAERVRREEEREQKRRLEEQERKKTEEDKERQRAEEERIRKEEEKRREEEERQIEEEEKIRKERIRMEEEERVRKEKEEMKRVAEKQRRQEEEEKKRLEEEERIGREEEERIRREEKAERERKEEEARKQEKKKLRDAEEQKKRENERKDGHKVTWKKSEVAVARPREITSNNPFDENYSYNLFEEDPNSPAAPDSSTTKVSNAQQRCQTTASLEGSKTDVKNLISAQREKRPAPEPPGWSQAERRTQSEKDVAARHLAQINMQSNDKDVRTVSVLHQRSVQMIAPLNRAPTDTKMQNSTSIGENVTKQSKRPAPSRPSVDDGSSSEPKTTLSSGGGSGTQIQVVYGLNPFDDEDEDEFTDQNDKTTTGNPGSIHWPPAASQTAAENVNPQTKIKSSKMAHAPPAPASKAATSSTLIHPNTSGDPLTDYTGKSTGVSACDSERSASCNFTQASTCKAP